MMDSGVGVCKETGVSLLIPTLTAVCRGVFPVLSGISMSTALYVNIQTINSAFSFSFSSNDRLTNRCSGVFPCSSLALESNSGSCNCFVSSCK